MKIILHIGGGKCGSSAIQQFLSKNAKKLRDFKIYVPSENLKDTSEVSGYHVWYFQEVLDSTPIDIPRFKEDFNSYIADKPQDGTIIFSAENLSNPKKCAEDFTFLKEKHDVKVIMYIRRQDNYFQSAWQQWWAKVNNDIYEWIIKNVGQLANWRIPIEDWQDAFGKENMIVRLFEQDQLEQGDVVFDFLSNIDINPQVVDNLDLSVTKNNVSLNLAVSDLATSSKKLFDGIHDNKVYNMIHRLTNDRHAKQKNTHILKKDIRKAVMSRYQVSNSWIKQQYFQDLNRPTLFKDIDLDESRVLSEKEIRDMKDELIFDLMHELYEMQRSDRRKVNTIYSKQQKS